MSLFGLLTDPTVHAVFPQELIDKVIVSPDPTNLQTFRACFLVAKSWIHPSWTMLFYSVTITSRDTFRRWCLKSASIGHVP
jgi:hypothetical protein